MTEEEEAIQELKSMSLQELDLVQHDVLKWICAGKNCNRGTHIRDYGISPVYYHKTMKWIDVNKQWITCSKHWKIYRRLIKNYPLEAFCHKIFDFNKNKTETKPCGNTAKNA